MSRAASLPLAPSAGLFSHLLVAVDRWLMTYAEITIQNGDTPRCIV